jgi:hypothetical protein
VMFLPPPPRGAASSIRNGVREKENSMSALEDSVLDQRQATLATPVPKVTAFQSYPSPKRSALSPHSSPHHLQRAVTPASKLIPTPSSPPKSRSRHRGVHDSYRPLSPPTSDPVAIPATVGRCPSAYGEDLGQNAEDQDNVRNEDRDGESDVAVQIDIASIGQRYSVVKARMREVRFCLHLSSSSCAD